MIKIQQTLRDPCGLPREPLGNSFISLKKDNTVILGTIPFNYRQKDSTILEEEEIIKFLKNSGTLCPTTLM